MNQSEIGHLFALFNTLIPLDFTLIYLRFHLISLIILFYFMRREDFKIEICANSAESVKVALRAGADRVELCAGMPEGGTTPSYGEMSLVRELMSSGVHVIIRPRGGDFLYNELECEVMQRDIEMARRVGVDGVVLGCLTCEGRVDMDKMRLLMSVAGDMSVTFHRAFDMCCDPIAALRDIEELGCHRILTSGQRASAEAGIPLLRELVGLSRRVIIMPGCGVNGGNILKVAEETGAREFHLSARMPVESDMVYRNTAVSMGGSVQVAEYGRDVTSEEKVKQAIDALL